LRRVRHELFAILFGRRVAGLISRMSAAMRRLAEGRSARCLHPLWGE